MMEFGENDKSSKESQDKTNRINLLSKRFSKCKELRSIFKERKKSLDDLISTASALQMSILSKQIKYDALVKQEDCVRKKYMESTEAADAMHQEFKNLKSKSIRHNFLERCANYADNFLHTYEKYSSDKLSKEIEQYTQKCEKMQQGLSMKIKELESLEIEHGLNRFISDGIAKENLKIFASLNDIMLNNRKHIENTEENIRIGQQRLKDLEYKLIWRTAAKKYIERRIRTALKTKT